MVQKLPQNLTDVLIIDKYTLEDRALLFHNDVFDDA